MNTFIRVLFLGICFVSPVVSQKAGPLVHLRNGSYEGLDLPEYDQDLFLGVPYAQNTGGRNRFRIPQSLNETWSGTRQATEYGNACPGLFPELDSAYGMSEDCLSINVVRPATIGANDRLPVMFWIYGGSFQTGTTGLPNYNLTCLVQRSAKTGRPVLGVSINYRKAAWGNLYSTEVQGSGNTNIALRDMRKALEWVSENIASFGGDPNLVTIWGESSGAFAVGQLLLSYGGRSDGLFHRAIQQSGSASSTWCNTTEWYQTVYNDIVAKSNCSEATDTLNCLRSVPYDLLFPLLNTYPLVNGGPGWYPTVDGDVLPEFPTEALHNGRFATSIPHLVGINTDEGSLSAPADGVINTDEDVRNFLLGSSGFNFPSSTVEEIMNLYPDNPAVGTPAGSGNARFIENGGQFKRIATIMGDVYYHAPRRDDARHYVKFAAEGADTYSYRYNTRGWMSSTDDSSSSGRFVPAYMGVAHASEIPFVFHNPNLVGGWPGYRELSDLMSDLWINFAYDGNPNWEMSREYDMNDGRMPEIQMLIASGNSTSSKPQTLENVNETGLSRIYWPAYNEDPRGLNLVLQTQGQGGLFVEADTYRKEGVDYLTRWARRRHV